MSDLFSDIFGDDGDGALAPRRYPGSKKVIPVADQVVAEASAKASVKRTSLAEAYDSDTWGEPRDYRIWGKPIRLWGVSSLGRALGKSDQSIRLWERQGRIPLPPYLLGGKRGPRGEECGDRYYSEESIISAIDLADRAGFFERERVAWDSAVPMVPSRPDAITPAQFTQLLRERWRAEVERRKSEAGV